MKQAFCGFSSVVQPKCVKILLMLPRVKIIGRGGVGMDNIDVDYAKAKAFT
jgi:lactate dehydrogenase-like 2-hydroxyacid dehydrogenase